MSWRFETESFDALFPHHGGSLPPNDSVAIAEASQTAFATALSRAPSRRSGIVVTLRANKALSEAVKIGAKALWLQFGVISPEGARIAREGGLQVVVDRCMKVEHARNLGRMHWLGFNTGVVGAQRASTL